MPYGGLSGFSRAPVLNALREPWMRLLGRTSPPVRYTADGVVYLGDGQPVMLFPLLGKAPTTTAALSAVLHDAGFTCYDWGLGDQAAHGEFGLDYQLSLLEEQVIDVFERQRRPVTLLGWGLSGVYAREVAKRTNPLVKQVITLSTPFNPAADPRRKCAMLQPLQGGRDRLEPALRHRLRQSPPVPCTSIYSTNDPSVPWRMCHEHDSNFAENVELHGVAHAELPTHPKVLEVITHRLAQPEEGWRPFDA